MTGEEKVTERFSPGCRCRTGHPAVSPIPRAASWIMLASRSSNSPSDRLSWELPASLRLHHRIPRRCRAPCSDILTTRCTTPCLTLHTTATLSFRPGRRSPPGRQSGPYTALVSTMTRWHIYRSPPPSPFGITGLGRSWQQASTRQGISPPPSLPPLRRGALRGGRRPSSIHHRGGGSRASRQAPPESALSGDSSRPLHHPPPASSWQAAPDPAPSSQCANPLPGTIHRQAETLRRPKPPSTWPLRRRGAGGCAEGCLAGGLQ